MVEVVVAAVVVKEQVGVVQMLVQEVVVVLVEVPAKEVAVQGEK